MSSHAPLSTIRVNSEDGELKEVVFGRIDDFRLPAYDPIFDFAGGYFVPLLKTHPNQLLSEADPEWYKRAHDSMEQVVSFLEDRGIVVHRPRLNTPDELANFALMSKMNINVYARDGQFALGDTLVEASFRTPERLRNKYSLRYVSMGLMQNGNQVISCPQPLDTYKHDEQESPLLEGGDVMVDGEHVYVGHSGNASNSLGIEWLRSTFPERQVHEIKIDTTRFPHQHLDCLLVVFSSWGCVLIEDIIGGYDQMPEPLKAKKWIKMTHEEATHKLGNFIAINPEEVVMSDRAQRLITEIESLRPRIKVHAFPYEGVNMIGGSFRCNTCPIFRD